MNILIALDDNFVKYYKVTLTSLFENNKSESIQVYLPHTDKISNNGIEELDKICQKYGQQLIKSEFKGEKLKQLQRLPLGMWSVEMFFRLFASEILPKEEDRVLWLDGDVIVNQNISEFYYKEFDEEKCFTACEDLALSRGKDKEVYQNHRFSNDEFYVNSGVIMINIKRLREYYNTSQIIDYALGHINILKYPDQDIINGMFHTEIKIADGMKYNCQMTGYSYTMAKELKEKAQIIHFTFNRPWNTDYQKHYSSAISGDIWWKYAVLCGYKSEYIKWKVMNTLKVKPWQIVYKVYKFTIGKKRK